MIQGCNKGSCQKNEGRCGWSREEVLEGESKAIVGGGNSETVGRCEAWGSFQQLITRAVAGVVFRKKEGRGGWSKEEVLGGESKAADGVGGGNSETARRAEVWGWFEPWKPWGGWRQGLLSEKQEARPQIQLGRRLVAVGRGRLH